MARQCFVSRNISNVQEAERRIFYNYLKKYSLVNRYEAIVSARAGDVETIKVRYDDFTGIDYVSAKNYGIYSIRKGRPKYNSPCLIYDVVKKAVSDDLWWIWAPNDRSLVDGVTNVTQRDYDPAWDNFPDPDLLIKVGK